LLVLNFCKICLIFVPTEEEVGMGKQVHGELKQQYDFSDDVDKVAKVRRIGQRIAEISDRQDYQYHFYVVDKDELNALSE